MSRTPASTSYARIVRLAWPIILANAASPLLGLSDTAIMGRHGSVTDLGAIALGALVFSFVYWPFAFLRMATTGFVAQASGAGNEAEVRATLGRALSMSVVLGVILMAVIWPIAWLAETLFDGSPATEAITRDYLFVRIWSAPAALASFAVLGTLIGLGQSRTLLLVQLFMNGLNVALDVFFAGVLGWGAVGIALGTTLAEWLSCILALVLTLRLLRARHRDAEPFLPLARIRDMRTLLHTLRAQADILIRTLLLLFGFAWFTQQSARFGDVTLAANHVLLQFVSFSAFFLDGFAFVAEALVGRAVGAGARRAFDDAVRRTTVLACLTSLALAIGLLALGPAAIHVLTDLTDVRHAAAASLPYAALYVALAVAAFQLDGVFIGATRTREMRNASLASVLLFLAAAWPLTRHYANDGLWYAFIVYVVARAACLGAYYPRLRRTLA